MSHFNLEGLRQSHLHEHLWVLLQLVCNAKSRVYDTLAAVAHVKAVVKWQSLTCCILFGLIDMWLCQHTATKCSLGKVPNCSETFW